MHRLLQQNPPLKYKTPPFLEALPPPSPRSTIASPKNAKILRDGRKEQEAWAQSTSLMLSEANKIKQISCSVRETGVLLRTQVQDVVNNTSRNVRNSLNDKIERTTELIESIELSMVQCTTVKQKLDSVKDKISFLLSTREGPTKVVECRRRLRQLRPERERINDDVEDALTCEGNELRDSVGTLQQLLESIRYHSDILEQMKVDLLADLEDKRISLNIDRACLHADCTPPGSVEGSAGDRQQRQAAHTDPINKSEGDPSLWAEQTRSRVQKITSFVKVCMQVCGNASLTVSELRKSAEAATSRVTNELLKRIGQLSNVHQQVQEQIQSMDLEVEQLHENKLKVQSELTAQEEPIGLARQRLALRRRRPARESTRDEVELQLEAELHELVQWQATLTKKVEAFEVEEERLLQMKKTLEEDSADKQATVDIDKRCLEVDTDTVDDVMYTIDSGPPAATAKVTPVGTPAGKGARETDLLPKAINGYLKGGSFGLRKPPTEKSTRKWPKFGFGKDPQIPFHIKQELMVNFASLSGGTLVDNYKQPQMTLVMASDFR